MAAAFSEYSAQNESPFIPNPITEPGCTSPVPQSLILPTSFVSAPSAPQTPSFPPGSPEERQQHYFSRYGEVRFRKHAPKWVDGDWLPHYQYLSADAIWDYWLEWKEGVDGFISVEELTTTWGAKWRRNMPPLKTENTRRMKVINLILELSNRPRWNVNLVRRFITEKYASQFRARAFADYLKTNRAAVVAAAAAYP